MGEATVGAGLWFRGLGSDWEPDIPPPSTEAERETLRNVGCEVDNNDLPHESRIATALRDLRFMFFALADGMNPNEARTSEWLSNACQKVGELAGADVSLGVPGVYRAALEGEDYVLPETVREARDEWDEAVKEANEALDLADELLSTREGSK